MASRALLPVLVLSCDHVRRGHSPPQCNYQIVSSDILSCWRAAHEDLEGTANLRFRRVPLICLWSFQIAVRMESRQLAKECLERDLSREEIIGGRLRKVDQREVPPVRSARSAAYARHLAPKTPRRVDRTSEQERCFLFDANHSRPARGRTDLLRIRILQSGGHQIIVVLKEYRPIFAREAQFSYRAILVFQNL